MRYQSLLFKLPNGSQIAGMHDFSSREEMVAQANHYAVYYREAVTVEKHGKRIFATSPAPVGEEAIIRTLAARLFPSAAF
jgi:hypothetical protein